MTDADKIIQSELTKVLKDNILEYWMVNTIDEEFGGFIGFIDFFNNKNTKANKGSVLNARILWTFAAAYNYFKEEVYLNKAKRAYEYILNHFIDYKHGGVFWELNYQGKPVNKRKQIYALSFTIYGLTEYYIASGDDKALTIAIDLFKAIEKHSLDKNKNGYIEAFAEDWTPLTDFRLSEKDANESKTMNTHLHILEAYTNLFRVHKNPEVKAALKNLIELFLARFINSRGHLNLFFNNDWELNSKTISFGHDVECSWLLVEAAEVLGDEVLLKKVKNKSLIMLEAVNEGLDKDGALFNEFEPDINSFDTDKHWWPQAEALVGFYNGFQITGNEAFKMKAFKNWEFIKKHLIDNKNGEWFWRVDKNGHPIQADEKAGFWKCPYHNSRACLEVIKRIEF